MGLDEVKTFLDEVYEVPKREAPILHFEDIDSVIQYIKDAGGVYVGSRSLGVGTEESDYDFIVDSEIGYQFVVDYESKGYNVNYLGGDYSDLDIEVFGEGFEENFKLYYYDDENKLYTLNFFTFTDESTIRKYKVLQDTMLEIPTADICFKCDRIKHFAHIQYVLDISIILDVPYDAKLFAEYSGKLTGSTNE